MKKTIRIVILTVLVTHLVWLGVFWAFARLTASPSSPATASEVISNRFALMLVRDVRDTDSQNFTFSVKEIGRTPTNFVATNQMTLPRSLHDGQEFTVVVHSDPEGIHSGRPFERRAFGK